MKAKPEMHAVPRPDAGTVSGAPKEMCQGGDEAALFLEGVPFAHGSLVLAGVSAKERLAAAEKPAQKRPVRVIHIQKQKVPGPVREIVLHRLVMGAVGVKERFVRGFRAVLTGKIKHGAAADGAEVALHAAQPCGLVAHRENELGAGVLPVHLPVERHPGEIFKGVVAVGIGPGEVEQLFPGNGQFNLRAVRPVDVDASLKTVAQHLQRPAERAGARFGKPDSEYLGTHYHCPGCRPVNERSLGQRGDSVSRLHGGRSGNAPCRGRWQQGRLTRYRPV